jgi:pimeloyl-ACP methyl ester carboxylesterase
MSKTHPISIQSETHALAGNLVLPDGAAADAPVPGAMIVGGPGPVPLQRYSPEGLKQWPVLWTEALAAAGVAGLCYDQRGAGLSTGAYHEADWEALYADARGVAEMLAVQPEVKRVAAIAWGQSCPFALQLAAEGKVHALVLLAPAYHAEEVRYARSLSRLAAQKGLSERVVQLRVRQWKEQVAAIARRVESGEVTATVQLGDQQVSTNLARFLQTVTFDAKAVAGAVTVPVLLLHGQDDTAIWPEESEALAGALSGQTERIVYPGVGHFLYRHPQALADAARWLRQVLA